VLDGLLKPYKALFTTPQFEHFRRYVTGLIVSDNKTIQEICDGFGDRDQSNMNRFISHSDWDTNSLNETRLQQVQNELDLKKSGVLIQDESLLHKSGKHMELAGMHRSGITKTIEWGHMVVNSFYTDCMDNDFPVCLDVYVREKDCQKYGIKFKTKREIAIKQIDCALKAQLPTKLILADANYESDEYIQAIRERGLSFMVGTRLTRKFSLERAERISVHAYLSTLTDDNFEFIFENNVAYFYHIVKVSIRGIGMIRFIAIYRDGDEEELRCYITDLEESNETIIKLLIKRWRIEEFHRDAKQHLGLEAYQVRKGRGMQIVALAILTAYTLAILAARILKTPLRRLRTIGEVCRYLQLVAYKGLIWFRTKLKDAAYFVNLMKKHVFVKNAKV